MFGSKRREISELKQLANSRSERLKTATELAELFRGSTAKQAQTNGVILHIVAQAIVAGRHPSNALMSANTLADQLAEAMAKAEIDLTLELAWLERKAKAGDTA